jgi:hypothetical protein
MYYRMLSLSAVMTALAIAGLASSASAAPGGGAPAIGNAVPNAVEAVQWRRGGWGRGWGWGLGAGLLGSAIIGGALATPYYYGYGPYYVAPAPYPAPAYGPQRYGHRRSLSERRLLFSPHDWVR